MARPTRTFDHYELVTDETGEYLTLGRGGLGSTFKARHTRLDTFHAVKVMNLGWRAARNIQLRFLHEATIAAKLARIPSSEVNTSGPVPGSRAASSTRRDRSTKCAPGICPTR